MDEKMKFYVTIVLLCILADFSKGFNVETKHYTVYREATNSMFGFSVAEHIDSFRNGWAIIGAPQAQTNQLEVEEGGAVYRCDITRDNGCTPIEFDPHGNHRRNYSKSGEIDNKSHQWFGATVSTSFVHGGPIMACAPRYIWYSTTLSHRDPIGTCYITKNSFSSPKEISPCRTRHWGYHRQGSCQAGLGAALSKDGERMYIGAPGSWYWQGQAFSINWHPKYRFLPPRNATYQPDPEGQVIAQWVDGLKPVMFTHESPSYADDSYLGYSVTPGEFLGNGDKGFAVGMPRGNELTGKVLLFTSTMKNWLNITGSQMGSYFGYSIIACDVDGDKLDDLIVGAPMFTIPDNPEMMFETGRIYIIRQGFETDKFIRMETRDGLTNRGRFGLSLASLNDIDQDGFGDFAVGAPYGGAKGRGAVYIYRGSSDGVLETYSQVIDAEHVESPVSTFGFSIAGGMDLDGNEYPDIIVGAYESSSAMFFRSRPVINIDAYMKFNSTSKLISLEQKNCKLSDRTTVPCLEIEGCLSFSGRTARDQFRLNVQYVLDTKKPKSPRLFFLEHESKSSINRTITLRRSQELCHSFKVYISPNIRDKLTSIDAEMRLSLIDEVEDYRRQRDPQAPLTSVLATRTSKKDSLSIFKECGADNICIPDLQMNVQPSVNKYLLGSGDTLELDITVKNAGEDAFEAMFNLKLPPGIDYINIRSNKTDIPVQCSAPKQSTNYTMRCDIGNPLPHDKFVHFKVILQPVTSQDMKAIYEFEMEANSTNPDNKNNQNDNYYHLALPIWVQTVLFVEGTSKPKDIHFDFADYNVENVTSDTEFGPLVTHNYTIRNDGPSNIVAAEAFLTWPAETLANDIFVYLLEQPETSPSVQCAEANWNSLSLKLEGKQRLYGGGTFQESLIGEKQINRVNAESHGLGSQQTSGGFHAQGGKYGSGHTETSSGTIVNSSGGSFSSSFSENKSSSSSSSEAHSGSTHGQVVFQQGSSSSEHGGAVAADLGREGGLREFEETRYSESHSGSSMGGGQQGGMGGGQQGGMGGTRYEETSYTQTHGGHATVGGYQTIPGGGRYEETKYTQSHGGGVTAGQQAGIGGREYEETRYTQSSGGSVAAGGPHSGTGGGGRYEETRYTQSHGGNVMTGGQSTGIGGGQYEETRYTQNVGGSVATGGQHTELGGGQYEETRYQQTHGGSITTGGQQIGLDGGQYGETRYTENHGERVTTGEQIGGGRYEETKHSQTHGGNTGIYGTQIFEGTRLIDLGQGTGIRNGQLEQTSHSTVHGGVLQDNSQFRENRTHGNQFQHEWSYTNREQGNLRNENEQSMSERQRYEEEQRVLQLHRLQLEKQRQEEDRRTKLERQRLETERQRGRVQGETTYGFERHYTTDSELPAGSHFQQGSTASGKIDGIIGNREYSFETTGDDYQVTKLRGIGQGLEKFFSTLDLDSPAVTSYSRNGKEYVSFEGRFRLAQGRQCIEFRNKQVFELLDSYGAPSLSTGSSDENSERFTTIEGEIVVEDNQNIYIRLNDGRKFRIPGTFTYKEEKTYTVGGGSREDYPRSYNYGKEITHERHSETESYKPYGGTYRTETYGREYKSEGHKSSGEQVHEIYGDNEPANYLDRYPREKSVDDLEKMLEWNKDFEDVKRRARASTHTAYGGGRLHTRERRAVVGVENPEITKILPKCASANCVTLRCTLGSLEKGQEVWIAMRSRINAKTLNKIAKNENLKVSTQLTARVTQQPFIGDVIVAEVKDHEIFTTVHPSAPSSTPDVVPLWVVVLSACAGTVILLLLVYLLYKCGFFKRNRPNDAPEREPLNKNGHYSN